MLGHLYVEPGFEWFLCLFCFLQGTGDTFVTYVTVSTAAVVGLTFPTGQGLFSPSTVSFSSSTTTQKLTYTAPQFTGPLTINIFKTGAAHGTFQIPTPLSFNV